MTGNTRGVQSRGLNWKQHDSWLCRNSTAKTKVKGNRPTRCLDSAVPLLTCCSVSFQRKMGLDFCEIYLAKIMREVGKEGWKSNCLQNNSLSSPPPHPRDMRYQWQKVMQIITTLSPVPWELGSSQWEGDKKELVKIPFMENSNIAKSRTGAVNSGTSWRT